MSDVFADVARAFLSHHFPNQAFVVFDSDARLNRMVYDFLEERYPKIDLTAKTVNRVAWSIGMLANRPAK